MLTDLRSRQGTFSSLQIVAFWLYPSMVARERDLGSLAVFHKGSNLNLINSQKVSSSKTTILEIRNLT